MLVQDGDKPRTYRLHLPEVCVPPSPTLSESLATWAVAVRYQSLPADVAQRTQDATLDLLGVALAGVATPAARIIRGLALEAGGRPEATVLGSRERMPACQAALANGTAAHGIDLDDGHRLAAGHPGVTVIPAALAAAEVDNATGADFLVAVAAGYEVFIRLASFMNPAHLRRGFHTTGTVGPLGAATAAGLLLGLDATRLAHALGAAASQGAGLLQVLHEGAILKPLHAGRAAQSGLLSAQYAARGGEAPRQALDGSDGYLRALSGSEDGPDLADLGPPRAILGAYYKLYAACRHVHPAVDAVLDLVGRDDLVPARVVQVHVRTHQVAERLTGRPGRVADIGGARFSLPFAVALAALRGSAGPEQFTPSALADEELWGFAERVRVVADPELTARYPAERGAIVTLHLADGTERTARVVHPRGEPENPVSRHEIANKFLANARPVLGDVRAKQVVALVRRLPEIPVRDLTAAVAVPSKRRARSSGMSRDI